MSHLFNCLLLLLFLLLLFLINLGDLGLLVLVTILIFVVGHLLLCGLLNPQRDWVVHKLGVLLDELLDAFLVEVLLLVILEVQDDFGATGEIGIRVGCNSE